MLKGKKIVLGITGSIAAYKACLIIRGLIKRGAEVLVVITPGVIIPAEQPENEDVLMLLMPMLLND